MKKKLVALLLSVFVSSLCISEEYVMELGITSCVPLCVRKLLLEDEKKDKTHTKVYISEILPVSDSIVSVEYTISSFGNIHRSEKIRVYYEKGVDTAMFFDPAAGNDFYHGKNVKLTSSFGYNYFTMRD